MKLKALPFRPDMLALTFLVVIHVANPYEFIEEQILPDFDEIFDDAEGKPDEAKDFELKRLYRRSRKAGGKGLDTEVLLIENERNVLDEAEVNEIEAAQQKEETRALVFQNLEKLGAALSTRNPFFVSKNHMTDRNLFHSPTSLVDINVHFKIVTPLATPYTRSNWEPNFLRNFIEHDGPLA